MNDAQRLTEQIKLLGGELGFARVGVARAQPLLDDAARLNAWLDAGYAGQMTYMRDTAEVRADPAHPRMLPSARSVIVLATSYARADDWRGPEPGRLARYARGRDYHGLLYDRTRPLRRLLQAHGEQVRACVDTLPVLERAFAMRAGVGFIGKNACLIVPGIGSHVLLSALVTSAELAPDAPEKERCGACRLCLDACPTRAFVAERELDARRCIAYLTIEHEGEIDRELREGMGDWLFGCDVCQDVCPYNRSALREPARADAFAVRERFAELAAEDFLRMDEACFDRMTRGSALRRAGRDGMARNAAIVLGNAGDKRHLPVLQRCAQRDRSAVVREAADWAITRLGAR